MCVRSLSSLPLTSPQKVSALEAEIAATLKERIMFFDGAMGTMIQNFRPKLDEPDFRGMSQGVHCSKVGI